MDKYVFIGKRRYYLYDTYNSYELAKKVALKQKKINKSRYFILKVDCGGLYPKTRYRLYFNKAWGLW